MRLSPFLPGTLLLAACTALSGCATANTTRAVPYQLPTLPVGTYANWQIQTGTALTSNAIILLSGPLEVTGSTLSGQLISSAPCSATLPRAFSGTLDSSTGALALATSTPGVSGQFTMSSATSGTGLLSGGAMGGGGGGTCLALVGNVPSIAVKIPTLTGTYKGTVTSSAGASSAVNLSLTQSTGPNTDAAFPLTATLQYAAGSCSTTYSLAGSISGASYTLTSATASGPTVSGLDTDNGQTLPTVSITIPTGSCATAGTYTGTLTLQ